MTEFADAGRAFSRGLRNMANLNMMKQLVVNQLMNGTMQLYRANVGIRFTQVLYGNGLSM